MFITNKTGMGLYFEKVDGRWWLADFFSNGLKDISLDMVAMEIRVWELFLDLVQWCKAVCGYMWAAMYDCSCYSASSARQMVLIVPMPFGFT